MTPAELLVAQRASAEWAPTLDDLALAAVCDDCAYMRAWGGRETRTLDTALRIHRERVARVLRGRIKFGGAGFAPFDSLVVTFFPGDEQIRMFGMDAL